MRLAVVKLREGQRAKDAREHRLALAARFDSGMIDSFVRLSWLPQS